MTRLPPESREYFTVMASLSVTGLILLSLAGQACQSAPSGEAPTPPPAITPQVDTTPQESDSDESTASTSEIESDSVLAFVDRLEDRGRKISALTGLIIYRKVDSLLNRHETRTGSFLYQARDGESPERLAVRFDQLLVNNVRRPRQREYVFDGTWLTEVDEDRRTIIRRQLAPEGQVIDLEGGGPIPLLAGHSREVLMKRYEITPIYFRPDMH